MRLTIPKQNRAIAEPAHKIGVFSNINRTTAIRLFRIRLLQPIHGNIRLDGISFLQHRQFANNWRLITLPLPFKSAIQHYSLSHLSILVFYLYGFWVALAYLIFAIWINKAIVGAFAIGSLLGGFALAAAFPKDLKLSIKNPTAWARSLFFALTQFFTFRALKSGDTTVVFCASAASLIIILPLARYLLNEQSGTIDYLAAFLALIGLCILAPDSHVTPDGIAAGIFQTASILASRKAGIQKQSLLGNTIHGLIVAGVICSPFAYDDISMLLNMPISIVTSGALIIITQIYFLWISFRFPVASVNQVSQTRIAWSLFLNSAWKLTLPTAPTLVGALLIMAPPFFVNRNTNSSKT
jgi:hypothetical protein